MFTLCTLSPLHSAQSALCFYCVHTGRPEADHPFTEEWEDDGAETGFRKWGVRVTKTWHLSVHGCDVFSSLGTMSMKFGNPPKMGEGHPGPPLDPSLGWMGSKLPNVWHQNDVMGQQGA